MADLEHLCNEAIALREQRAWTAAEQKYLACLQQDAEYVPAWQQLGTLYADMGRCEDAVLAMRRLIHLEPQQGAHYRRLGDLLTVLERHLPALRAYEHALACGDRALDTFLQTGKLLVEQQAFDRAEQVYRGALQVHSNSVNAWCGFGDMLLAQQRVEAAIAAYRQAADRDPHNPSIARRFERAFAAKGSECAAQIAFFGGFACYWEEAYAEAIARLQTFLSIAGTELLEELGLRVYLALGHCLRLEHRLEEAIDLYRQGLDIYPTASELHYNLICTLLQRDRTPEAVTAAKTASDRLGRFFFFRELFLELPALYETVEEIQSHRDRFQKGLNTLTELLPLALKFPQDALNDIATETNFFLAYQGQNDVALQQQYGQLIHQVLAVNYPQFVKPLAMPPVEHEVIRVGYISAFMCRHTVGKLFVGWVCDRRNQEIETHVFHLGNSLDDITADFQKYSNVFYHLPFGEELDRDRLLDICQQIRDANLHILVFLDVGMHPITALMAGLRLAPIQCVTWGHPVTTGLPTIEYFLSSDLMEPPEAQAHYSEQLVRLPNMGIFYRKPWAAEPAYKRSHFGLRADAIVYLSCQTAYKYLPQYDWVFAAIARRVPQAQFAFVPHMSAEVREQFHRRLQRAFAAVGLDSEAFCVVLPRRTGEAYPSLMAAADIYLDTFAWSGGMTTLDAVVFCLPVVTCPGAMMRSRHSAAIFTMMEVTEAIAQDPEAYVDIAVKLGLDPDWRVELRQKIARAQDKLYSDRSVLDTLTSFYRRVVRRYRG